MNTYTSGQRLAIGIGAAATIGAIALLLSDALGGHWTIEHAMTPLIVCITVASGHLVSTAIRDRKPIAALGFLVAFAVGSAITVLNGVGRQTEGAEGKAAAATAHNVSLAAKMDDLRTSRQRLADAQKMVDLETRQGGCGRACTDWKRRTTEVQSHVTMIEAEVGKLGAAKPVNAKAEKAAQIAALLGGDHDRAKAAVVLLEPVAVPFLLEWVAIVALGFGFGHRRAIVKASETVKAEPKRPVDPKPKRSRRGAVEKDGKVVAFVTKYRATHGRDPSLTDMTAAFPAMPRSTAQRYRREGGNVTAMPIRRVA